jgi:hypothetical protein
VHPGFAKALKGSQDVLQGESISYDYISTMILMEMANQV